MDLQIQSSQQNKIIPLYFHCSIPQTHYAILMKNNKKKLKWAFLNVHKTQLSDTNKFQWHLNRVKKLNKIKMRNKMKKKKNVGSENLNQWWRRKWWNEIVALRCDIEWMLFSIYLYIYTSKSSGNVYFLRSDIPFSICNNKKNVCLY